MVSDLMNLYALCDMSGKKDSADYFFEKSLSISSFLPDFHRANFYTNLAMNYEHTDEAKAESYFRKSLEVSPSPHAYNGLARMEYNKGRIENAEQLWNKALDTDNTNEKIEVLGYLKSLKESQNKLAEANVLSNRIINLKDSLEERTKQDNLVVMQVKFDTHAREKKLKTFLVWLLVIIATAIVSIVCIATYGRFRRKKQVREMSELQGQINSYKKEIERLKMKGTDSQNEIYKLQNVIANIEQIHSKTLEYGKQLYDHIMSGGTVVNWKKTDFEYFIEFYKLTDLQFVNMKKGLHESISPKYLFFDIMVHEGKSDQELQHIMGIGASSVRSIKSRIRHSGARLDD